MSGLGRQPDDVTRAAARRLGANAHFLYGEARLAQSLREGAVGSGGPDAEHAAAAEREIAIDNGGRGQRQSTGTDQREITAVGNVSQDQITAVGKAGRAGSDRQGLREIVGGISQGNVARIRIQIAGPAHTQLAALRDVAATGLHGQVLCNECLSKIDIAAIGGDCHAGRSHR